MKKLILWATLCLVIGTVSSAWATPTIYLEDGLYRGGNGGGEFKATVNGVEGLPGNPVGSTWQTFCLERNEYVKLPGTYYAVVNTAAVQGGLGGPSPDPLSPKTAWLYTKFIDGTLVDYGYDYSTVSGRKNSATALQKAIWKIEQEITYSLSGLALNFYNQADNCGWTDIGDIRVLNLYNNADLSYCNRAQDLLISIGTPIPVPGGIFLVGIGTVVVGWYRRRRAL